MLPAQIPRTERGELSRCKDTSQLVTGGQKDRDENTKADAVLAYEVDRVLWKDAAFKSTEYDNIDVKVSGGIVSLYGHITSLANQQRAEKALQSVPGLSGVDNHLIPDDKLVAEVATSLGALEHTYGCKFFTGVSHGVVFLSGSVGEAKVILLAEKCAAGNPNVRAVINSVHVPGGDLVLQNQLFLQPSIGEEIIFLDGISGVVRQVIINPNNRRVVAMTVWGRFVDQRQELKSMNEGEACPTERLIVVPINLVRYLTRVSGFLFIHSNEINRHLDFNAGNFFAPEKDWAPPYPYCPNDVLFPVEFDQMGKKIKNAPNLVLPTFKIEEKVLSEELLANDSLGG